MAIRPVFMLKESSPFYEEENIDFTYYPGLADNQRKRSSESLRSEYLKGHAGSDVLEVSRFSDSWLGQRLSAFNLMYEMSDSAKVPVENVFQSSKVLHDGSQYLDLLSVTPLKAKKDERIRKGGDLTCFRLEGIEFPLVPKTFFYDWVYMKALNEEKKIVDELLKYDAFTDIVFNPEKSINCQARTVAMFVSLLNCGKLQEVLEDRNRFKETVYLAETGSEYEQMSFC